MSAKNHKVMANSKKVSEEAMYIASLEKANENLTRELNRYKAIIRDIKRFDGLTSKTLEDIRDLKC